MTHWRKLHNPTEYLAWWDLPADRDVPLTITKVERAELRAIGGRGPKDRKPVLHFEGTAKKLIANITNCKMVAALHGDTVEGWVGKRIAVGRATTEAKAGGIVPCVRVRNYAPEAAQPKDPPPDIRADAEPPQPVESVADAETAVVTEVVS